MSRVRVIVTDLVRDADLWRTVRAATRDRLVEQNGRRGVGAFAPALPCSGGAVVMSVTGSAYKPPVLLANADSIVVLRRRGERRMAKHDAVVANLTARF